MVSPATSGRLHGRHLDFYVTSSLSETVSPNFTKFDRIDLLTLGHVPAKHDVINYFLSAADAILKKKYFAETELLAIGIPNLVQRFITTLSQNLPEVVPPATSGR